MRDLVIRQYIERLHRERTLAPDEFRILLTEYHTGTLAYINELARSVAREPFWESRISARPYRNNQQLPQRLLLLWYPPGK